MAATNGVHTPSYGGVVNTGVEWEWVVHADGTKSRTPSRSPHRGLPEPHQHRSMSNPLDAATTTAAAAELTAPIPPASASAHAFTTHPSAHPHEPTISEEASAYVGRSVAQSQPPAPQAPAAAQSQASQQRVAAAAAAGRASPSPRPQPSTRSSSQPAAGLAPPSTAPAATGGRESSREATAAGAAPTKRMRQYRQAGDWILQKTLGQGSMGKVKLGVNVNTQERCAVKIVPRHRDDPKSSSHSGKSKDESKEIRTVREASISLLLHHPYVCGMRDFLVHHNHYYMVFEYIDGGQMLDYIIAHGRLRERAARKFARQIGSALDYCHHNNIVHRDLKIENILISNNGNIKIIDFGLSNLYSPRSHLSTFCGSLYFAAPELLNARLYTGPEVDIWSFGIVLYVLVCGKVPFDDQSMPALHAKIKRGLAEYPAWLSNDCKALLQRMLNTNPAERATLAEVLNHPWMTKGYDGRPDSHLIQREPLRAEDVDRDVVKRMQGFTFGTPDEIYDNLQRILLSEGYLKCVAAWEARRETRRATQGANGSSHSSPSGGSGLDNESPKKKRFSGFDLKKKLFKEEKKPDEAITPVREALDPSSGYDPLISIYFLAREKKERAKVFGDTHFASSRASLDEAAQSNYNINLPNLAAPPSAHGSGFEQGVPGSPRDNATLQPHGRLPGGELPPTAPMQHPSADGARSNIADVPAAVHRRGGSQAASAALSSTSAAQPPTTTVQLTTDNVDKRRSSQDNKHERRTSMGSLSNTMGRTSLSRHTSQRTNTPAQPVTPPDWSTTLGVIQDKSGGIRPVGSAEVDEVEAADVAMIDVKSVYLRGLFSVSTTSTKSARTLLRDISGVLERVGIKYRPIRGGFECIHAPSIDLTSVVHGDEARSSLHVPPGAQSLESSPSKNKLALRKPEAVASTVTSRGDSSSPALHDRGGSSGTVGVDNTSLPKRVDLDDGDAWGAQFGASSALTVRFEVFVVKVPWLPLHGIQFRRVGGDGWQYQQLAKTILREMRL
ncbi:Serine/threonine-protein kinase [Vanrija albida]|uniref:non-specific serine/threonine protein kinase n=1 Tax=Vanrija albida TaxID=181172 RepID=A0ABR3Q8N8_9TREE